MTGLSSVHREVVEGVERLRPELIEQTAEFVRIPTVNPYSGDRSAGNEKAGQEYLAQRCREAGAAAIEWVDVPADVFARAGLLGPTGRVFADRPNLVATFDLGGGCDVPTVLLNCHVDTVGSDGMSIEPFSGEIKDGAVWGRGSSDSKGNLLVGLTAIRALQQAGVPGCRIVYESVVDEECNGSGAGTLACCLAGYTADHALVLDGSGLYPCTGCYGVATAEVTVTGHAGHAAFGPSINAIDKAVVVKHVIDEFKETWESRYEKTRLNLGVFRAGTIPAVVPGKAVLQLNLTYPLERAAAAERAGRGWNGVLVREEFEQAVHAGCAADAWLAGHLPRVDWIKDLVPFETPVEAPLVQAAGNALALLDRPARPQPMTAWFDAAHLARMSGVPVIGLGSGKPGAAHSATEHVLIDDLVAGAKAVALTVLALSGR